MNFLIGQDQENELKLRYNMPQEALYKYVDEDKINVDHLKLLPILPTTFRVGESEITVGVDFMKIIQVQQEGEQLIHDKEQESLVDEMSRMHL